KKEIAQHVVIEQGGEAGTEDSPPRRGAFESVGAFSAPASECPYRAVGREFVARPYQPDRRQRKGPPLRLPKQEQGCGKEYEVGQPGSERGTDPALFGQRNPDQRNEVVDEDQRDREHESARLAALLRGESQRDSDHGQHQTRRGQGEAAVELDEIPTRRHGIDAGGAIVQRPRADRLDRDLFFSLALGGRQFDGDVSLLEGGDLVVVGFLWIGFVGRTVFQVQVQAVLALGDEDAFAGQRDARIGGIRDVGEKHALPNRATLSAVHVLHVEHELRKAFIEHSGLHFKGNLRAFELIFQASQRCQRPRRQVKPVAQSQQPGGGDKNRQYAAKAP